MDIFEYPDGFAMPANPLPYLEYGAMSQHRSGAGRQSPTRLRWTAKGHGLRGNMKYTSILKAHAFSSVVSTLISLEGAYGTKAEIRRVYDLRTERKSEKLAWRKVVVREKKCMLCMLKVVTVAQSSCRLTPSQPEKKDSLQHQTTWGTGATVKPPGEIL